MTKSRGRATDEAGMQDFSDRYRGAQQVEVERGGWFEFAKVGDELVGTYQGSEPFRNGVKSKLLTADGKQIVFSTPTLLRDQLAEIKIGENIAIVLRGYDRSGKNEMKVFQVFRMRSSR